MTWVSHALARSRHRILRGRHRVQLPRESTVTIVISRLAYLQLATLLAELGVLSALWEQLLMLLRNKISRLQCRLFLLHRSLNRSLHCSNKRFLLHAETGRLQWKSSLAAAHLHILTVYECRRLRVEVVTVTEMVVLSRFREHSLMFM